MPAYFKHLIPISAQQWQLHALEAFSRQIGERRLPQIIFYRQLALSLNKTHSSTLPAVSAAQLNLFAILQAVYRFMTDVLAENELIGALERAMQRAGYDPAGDKVTQAAASFVALFPPAEVLPAPATAAAWLDKDAANRHLVLREMLLLHTNIENPAVAGFRDLFDDRELMGAADYKVISAATNVELAEQPYLPQPGCSLGDALRAPIKAAPDSLAGQLRFVRDHWHTFLPPELMEELAMAFDYLLEEERERGWGGEPGPPPVLEFKRSGRVGGRAGWLRGDSVFAGFDYPEYENFSQDADWMSNVVMMAKMAYVWLDQLSRTHGLPIKRLDQVPDAELDRLAEWGFSSLWLIGLWERSPASQRIKQICGNPDAIASAYSLYDYEVAADLGGWEALANLRERAGHRGIRLASDMVPNHTGIYSRWVIQHPDWFVQTDYPPFPTYQFNGEDLSCDSNVCLQIEDGYWSKHDAAVVFKHYDRRDGRTRYIYHGNDGTSIPWNDTAQLNYLIPEVREAVIQTILHVARNFPIIRFDAAMTLAKKHYQRLWFPLRGLGGGIPSRSDHGMSKEEFDAVFPVEFWREVVDRVAVEAPGTLLLAEAFWMMEGYFVRTLGMHRVYNSAFMNMLKVEDNQKYRHTIKNVLEFNPEVLKRFVNFMNNPDEKTAVEQFGSQDKYFGACVLLATMPGLPMFGHGQIEGFKEKYGMEYKCAYWDEQVDEGLVGGHELWIFPLLRRRWLFSGSENFMLYDLHGCDCINENVFAYSNRAGEHRSLVLYHNSFSTAAGWIRESCGFAVKSGNGEPEIRRTTLGVSLGLSGEDGLFCSFRDHVTGLAYLRNGSELCDCGLYVDLKEYQFYVFLDFREFRDDSEGSWNRLCEELGGLGVENLEEELKQSRYRVLNDAFTAVIELMQGEALSGIKPGAVASAARSFYIELQTLDDGKASESLLSQQLSTLESRLKRTAALLKAKPVSDSTQAFHARLTALCGSADDRHILSAWMLLFGMPPGVPERFGLDCTLRRMLDRDCARHSSALLCALLALPDVAEAPAGIFSVPACRDFMGVHDSRGAEWFNKELFEELGEWLALVALVDAVKPKLSAAAAPAAMAKAQNVLNRSFELAAHAGYRTGQYRHMYAQLNRSD